VAFLRRDQSKQEVFVSSMKRKECITCMVMQQVDSLAVNISLGVLLSTCYSEIVFCLFYSIKHSSSLIVEFLFCNKWFSKFHGISEQVVEIADFPDGEDSVTVFSVENIIIS
jgi:hypothetical protein